MDWADTHLMPILSAYPAVEEMLATLAGQEMQATQVHQATQGTQGHSVTPVLRLARIQVLVVREAPAVLEGQLLLLLQKQSLGLEELYLWESQGRLAVLVRLELVGRRAMLVLLVLLAIQGSQVTLVPSAMLARLEIPCHIVQITPTMLIIGLHLVTRTTKMVGEVEVTMENQATVRKYITII